MMSWLNPHGVEAQSQQRTRQSVETTPRQRMVALAGITVLLIIIAAAVLVVTSSKTPLGRCNGIVISQQRESCLISLANLTRNASVCGYLPQSSQGACVSNIALAEDNESVCRSVIGQNASYAQCVTAVGSKDMNAAYCSSLGEPYVSYCAYAVANAQGFTDLETCQLIGNSSMYRDCSYRSYYSSAIYQRKAGYCGYLPQVYNSSLIYYMLQSSTKLFGTGNVTSVLPYLNTTPQSYCYYNLALLKYNESLCSSTTGSLNTLCTSAFSEKTQRNSTAARNITLQNVTALCSSVPSEAQEACTYALYIYIASARRNASVCGMIPTGQYQYGCYSQLASTYGDLSYCNYIDNATSKTACAYGVSSNSTR